MIWGRGVSGMREKMSWERERSKMGGDLDRNVDGEENKRIFFFFFFNTMELESRELSPFLMSYTG